MQPTRSLLNVLAGFALLTSCGCSAGRAPSRVSPPPEPPHVLAPVTPAAADHAVQPAPAPTDGWAYWQVEEGEAETVLVAVVRSGRRIQTHEAPLRRSPPGEGPGTFVSGSMGIGHGTSPNGKRFAVYDSFAVTGDPGPDVTLSLSSTRSGWTGVGHNARGFRQRLTVPVGRPSERRLSEDATLMVSFREPKRVPRVPEPEPAWEQELARERGDPSAVPLPPPWGAD